MTRHQTANISVWLTSWQAPRPFMVFTEQGEHEGRSDQEEANKVSASFIIMLGGYPEIVLLQQNGRGFRYCRISFLSLDWSRAITLDCNSCS